MAKVRKVPERMCTGCRVKRPKREMVRVVRNPEGEVSIDLTGKRAGRGAYLCPEEDCLRKAMKNKGLERALSVPIGVELLAELVNNIRKQGPIGSGGE